MVCFLGELYECKKAGECVCIMKVDRKREVNKNKVVAMPRQLRES